ncbi:MAG: diadenylate cyclase, partial [Lachnospiraceae bacterium]|nr:diadenylate cyclase [Lachnospiraceae bacterium]
MKDFIQVSGNTLRIGFFSMTFTWSGVLEILIFAVLAYYIIMWFKRSKAWNLLKGLGLLLAVYIAATLLKLDNLAFIFEKLFSSIVLAVIIIFQPEIRRGLEQIGTKNLFRELIPNVNAGTYAGGLNARSVDEITNALTYMGRNKVGALIVIERNLPLDEIIETGITLDAEISTALLEQIFEKNTPLHDGAVMIRNNRIVAATCLLPRSQNM